MCPDDPVSPDIEVTLRIQNRQGREVTFVLEPWGEVYHFAPRDEFFVTFTGPQGTPQVDVEDDAVVVWAWQGCTATLKKNGTELGSTAGRFRVPGGMEVLRDTVGLFEIRGEPVDDESPPAS
jgi:hypothetical protein